MRKTFRPAARPLALLLPLLAALAAGVAAADPVINTSSDHPTTQPINLPRPPAPADPMAVTLSPKLEEALKDTLLTEPERRAMLIFHGQWDRLKDLTPAEAAAVALQRYDLNNPALSDPSAPALVRARAAYQRGDMAQVQQLLAKETTIQASVLRAQTLEQLGQMKAAAAELTNTLMNAKNGEIQSAAELSAKADGLLELAALGGPVAAGADTRPADSQPAAVAAQLEKAAVDLYGKAYQDLDKLYYPAMVGQARILADRDSVNDAMSDVHDALTLNPSDGDAWFEAGMISADALMFDRAHNCIDKLRKINPSHPLADELEVQTLILEHDAAGARKVLAAGLARYPRRPMFMALSAAVAAAAYDQPGLDAAMAAFTAAWPRNPLAYMVTGDVLSTNRQYDQARKMIQSALDLQPQWSRAWIAMGMLLMQSGDEAAALKYLERATILNPYDYRAANQYLLVQRLLHYEEIKTPHFIIKYRNEHTADLEKGHDDHDIVLARDMPKFLEKMYDELTAVYQHRPVNTTIIEILPDEATFAVRITGSAEIWTIGASTGDLIAITPPREGEGQSGDFDWTRVIRHEFVHTITLDQSHNRVPHWFTEACAVSQEPGDRDYFTCKLLAQMLYTNKLYTLANIDWGFARPVKPTDRPLAYAQSHWMLQYITATWGHEAVVKFLTLFGDGATVDEAMLKVTGMNSDAFMAKFIEWGAQQLQQWGLGRVTDKELLAALPAGLKIDQKLLTDLLAKFPNEPNLLEIAARRAVDTLPPDEARKAVLRYAQARPVDPWAQRALLTLASKDGHPEDAQGALEYLDRQQQTTGAYANALANLYVSQQHFDLAAQAIQRALDREPYNATYREQAARIALLRGDKDQALFELQDLPLLEPRESVHEVRLAALYHSMGKLDEAKAAAAAALKLDPAAPVKDFMQ